MSTHHCLWNLSIFWSESQNHSSLRLVSHNRSNLSAGQNQNVYSSSQLHVYVSWLLLCSLWILFCGRNLFSKLWVHCNPGSEWPFLGNKLCSLGREPGLQGRSCSWGKLPQCELFSEKQAFFCFKCLAMSCCFPLCTSKLKRFSLWNLNVFFRLKIQ